MKRLNEDAVYIINMIKKQVIRGNISMSNYVLAIHKILRLSGIDVSIEEAIEVANDFYFNKGD